MNSRGRSTAPTARPSPLQLRVLLHGGTRYPPALPGSSGAGRRHAPLPARLGAGRGRRKGRRGPRRGGAGAVRAEPPAHPSGHLRPRPVCPEGSAGVTTGPVGSCPPRCMSAGPTANLRTGGGSAAGPARGEIGVGRSPLARPWLSGGALGGTQGGGSGAATCSQWQSPPELAPGNAAGLWRAGTAVRAGQGRAPRGADLRPAPPPPRPLPHPGAAGCDQASGGDTPARGSGAARPGPLR